MLQALAELDLSSELLQGNLRLRFPMASLQTIPKATMLETLVLLYSVAVHRPKDAPSGSSITTHLKGVLGQ